MLTFETFLFCFCNLWTSCTMPMDFERCFAVLLQSDMTIRNAAVIKVQCPSAAGCSTPASVRPEQRAATRMH